MSIVMGVDLETDGLSPVENKIIEIGIVIREINDGVWHKKAIHQESFFLWDEGYLDPMPFDVYKIHNISSTLLKRFGLPLGMAELKLLDIIDKFHPDYFFGHNAINFDKPFLLEQFKESKELVHEFNSLFWIDSKIHIDYDEHIKHKNLIYLAAIHGFINFFPHSALSDIQTAFKVLEHYDFNRVLERAKERWLTIRAIVDIQRKHLAKEAGFQWNPEAKIWTKNIPESEFDKLKDSVLFKIVELT